MVRGAVRIGVVIAPVRIGVMISSRARCVGTSRCVISVALTICSAWHFDVVVGGGFVEIIIQLLW